MIGKGDLEALQEIHTFLLPLNPSEQMLQKYYAVVDTWNKQQSSQYLMKPCFLCLVFNLDGKEVDVCVMQSARYLRTNSVETAVSACKEDSRYFELCGFEILREKIEANAHSIDGVPCSVSDMLAFPNNYFEHHIKVQRKDRDNNEDITPEEIEELRCVSRYLTYKYKSPVPLSYNKNKDKNNGDKLGHQRFLNVRFRGIGLDQIKTELTTVKNIINTWTNFVVIKSIDEYVWYDTKPSVDHGWIDFEPGAAAAILENLKEYFEKL
jgi:hypothetical protein